VGRKARRNLRANGQEPHRAERSETASPAGLPAGRARRRPATPIRHDELAQHSEVVWFTRGGKCGGCAGKHRALTWGIWRERSGQKSAEAIVVGETSRSANEHVKIAGGLTQRRAELYGDAQTAWRTVNPSKTPDGEVEPRVVTMGSMWVFRSGLRSVSHAGSSRVCAEPPCTDPYARWCGTRGWLSQSVTGTRFSW
jgi:hypothetical protein